MWPFKPRRRNPEFDPLYVMEITARHRRFAFWPRLNWINPDWRSRTMACPPGLGKDATLDYLAGCLEPPRGDAAQNPFWRKIHG